MQNKQEFLYRGPNHAANLNDMRLKDKYCDVTIKVDGKEIRAHKVILAANLKYFETMFSSNSFQESQGGIITMESVEKTNLELFVSYAYTGEILLTDSNALNLLELANYLSEDGIEEACVAFLEKNLKAEEACRAYKFSNTIDCLTLKNAAKAKTIANFGECSKSAEYLNFDPESLMDILSDGKVQSIQTQKILFEGIMRWIMHDAKTRKICLKDLLNSIDISKLKDNDVTDCLYKIIVHCDDEYGVTKDTIIYYKSNQIEQKEQQHVLMMIHDSGSFQFYDFIEKKWSLQQNLSGTDVYQFGAVLHNKLYYIGNFSGGRHLRVFDPSLKQITSLHSSSSILALASLCACRKFLYICGGVEKDHSRSDQVLRYESQTDSFQTLTPMGIKRSSAAAILYQGCLHVLGGHDGSSTLRSVEKYDPNRNEWTASASMCKSRFGHAVVILDEKLYVCGGDNESSVEAYNPTTNSWQLVASMNKKRSYFLLVAYKGRLLAVGGGGEKTVEVYDPSKNQWQMDDEMSSGLQIGYRAGGLISSSCIANTQ